MEGGRGTAGWAWRRTVADTELGPPQSQRDWRGNLVSLERGAAQSINGLPLQLNRFGSASRSRHRQQSDGRRKRQQQRQLYAQKRQHRRQRQRR